MIYPDEITPDVGFSLAFILVVVLLAWKNWRVGE